MEGLSERCHWLLSAVVIQLLRVLVSLSLNVVPAIAVDEFTSSMNLTCPSWRIACVQKRLMNHPMTVSSVHVSIFRIL